MIKLINGRGQLGDILKNQIKNIQSENIVFIYHTWDPWTREHHVQKHEYNKFIKFVDKQKEHRIIFISTCSQNDNYYVHFKQLAEAYLILNCENCLIIRLPNLVGNKGILKKLKDKTASPYGNIELLRLSDASKKIIDLIQYNGLVKIFSVEGEKISATLVSEMLDKRFNALKNNGIILHTKKKKEYK